MKRMWCTRVMLSSQEMDVMYYDTVANYVLLYYAVTCVRFLLLPPLPKYN